MTARETALRALILCRRQDAWPNAALKSALAESRTDRRDAALATRLCYGVLQNRRKMDFYLKQLLSGRIKDLRPTVRDILHLGLYQILEMDRVPDSAAVNESVELAKRFCRDQRNAPGLVNAVLRRASRERATLRAPTSLADRYSHSPELIALLREYAGDDIEAVLAANNAAPPTVIQTNTLKITLEALLVRLEGEGARAVDHPWLPGCLKLTESGPVDALPSFREGLFYIQDAAAHLAALCALTPEPQSRILDCCAAPGGKSVALAIALAGRGTVYACDIHPHKLPLIERNAARLGLTNLRGLERDASKIDPDFAGRMDAVLADVPCSGYGIIRKKPDLRDKLPGEDLPALQAAILDAQAEHVRPGGVLVYSTCTLVRRENEEAVEAFLKRRPDFSLEPLPLPPILPKNEGMVALLPGKYDTDGFFISRMRRKL